MADEPHVTYSVTGQQKMTEPDGQGGFHSVWHINYTTPSGTASRVTVPETHYTARNVHDAIMHEMRTVEHVNSLQPGVPTPRQPQA